MNPEDFTFDPISNYSNYYYDKNMGWSNYNAAYRIIEDNRILLNVNYIGVKTIYIERPNCEDLINIKEFSLLEDKEKFLICDYLHYSLNDLGGDCHYEWGGEDSPYYDRDPFTPWGFKTLDGEDRKYGEIFEQLKTQVLQKKINYGILAKVEFLIGEDSFCFTFWDCEESEIDFSKLPDFSCSVNSPEELTDECICVLLRRKEVLRNRLRAIESEANQLKTAIKNIDNKLKKISVSSFEEQN